MNLSDWRPYVLPQAKGCAEITADFNVLLALIELCRDSLVWREYQTPIATVASQTVYGYAPAAGQQVVKLLGLRAGPADGQYDIRLVDALDGKSLDSARSLSAYAYGTMTGIELRPALDAGQTLVTYAAVAPSIAAESVPDSFGRYVEAVSRGALSRILATHGRDYSDQPTASLLRAQWQNDIAAARVDAFRAFSRTAPRTVPVWM